MMGPEIIDHAEPRVAISPKALGEAAARAAWEARGRSLLLRPPVYQEAVSELAGRCDGLDFDAAKRSFDKQLAGLAATAPVIVRPRLPQRRRRP